MTPTPPREWKVERLLDLVSIGSGQVDPKLPQYRDMPLIAPDHIESGTGRLLEVRSAREQGAISGKYLVDPGDIIYSKIRPYLVKAHRAAFPALCSADMYPLKPRKGVDGRFVLNVLLGQEFTNFAVGESMRSGIPKINREGLAGFELPVPPSSEQVAIGSALGDAADLVQLLERSIIKKRSIKQGMMQELLTGRTRLAGFTKEWQPTTLGSVGSTYGGLTGKSGKDFGHGNGRFVTFVEVMRDARLRGVALAQVDVKPGERQNGVRQGDILFNGSSETPEEVALASVVEFDAHGVMLNSFCFGYRLARVDLIDPLFLAYFFRATPGRNLVVSLAQGSTRYNIAKTKLMKAVIDLPELAEQRAISAALHDDDAEIDALENRLVTVRAIRQGMMQGLLPGRTRLTVKEDAA